MLDIDLDKLAGAIDGKNTDDDDKPKKKFFPAPDVEAKAKELIPRFHPHLIDAHIDYTYRDGKWNKNDRPVVGDVKLISPYYNTLTGLDFGIVINYQYWTSITSVEQHKAIIDHLLSFCNYTEDKEGNRKWKKIVPTIHEFPEVVARHGAYNEDVTELANSLEEFAKD